MDNQRPVSADVSEQGISIRPYGPEASEEVLRRARRRALYRLVFAVAPLPVVVAVAALADDLWLRAVSAAVAVLLSMQAVRSVREYRQPLRTLRLTLRDVLERTLDRRQGEAVPFPEARSISERILLLQNDLDLIEASLKLNTGTARLLWERIGRRVDWSSTALARLLARQISHRTLFRGVLVVSLIIGLAEAIVISASGATAVGAAVFGAAVAVFALLLGYGALVLGIHVWFGDDIGESRASRAADILRGELATARWALTEDRSLDSTDGTPPT